MMSNDIRILMDLPTWRDHYKTRTVCAWNDLPLVVTFRPALYIVNTLHSQDEGIGHWICFVFPDVEMGNIGIFFDSLGKRISCYPPRFKSFLEQNCFTAIQSVTIPIQKDYSIRCGEFCLYFTGMITKGVEMNNILYHLYVIRESEMMDELNGILCTIDN